MPSRSPVPPAELLERIANDRSVEAFTASLAPLRDNVFGYLEGAGYEFGRFKRILDLGCGVGRFLFAIRDSLTADQQVSACDVDIDCARWCRENIDFADVRRTDITPPLPYADGEFDLVYALSVFTHLPFEQQFAWAREIHRVLRPGGILFFTTMGVPWLPLAVDQQWARRDFVTLGTDGLVYSFSKSTGREIEGQREIAVIQSKPAIDTIFSAFESRAFHRVARLAGGQDLSIVEKPDDALPVVLLSSERKATLRLEAGEPVRLTLDTPPIARARRWRTLLSFAEPRRDADRLRMAVLQHCGGRELRSEVELPFRAYFGPRHFVPIDVEMAAEDGARRIVFEVSWKSAYRPRNDVEFALAQARIE